MPNPWNRKAQDRPESSALGRTGEINNPRSSAIKLDLSYYRERYPDLSHLSDEELEKHWHTYGYMEGRFASASHAAGTADPVNQTSDVQASTTAESSESWSPQHQVDLEFYLALYPDLEPNGITTQSEAEAHYQQHGKSEERVPSLTSWAEKNHLPVAIMPDNFSLADVLQRSGERGMEVEPHHILDTLLGQHVVPIAFAETADDNLRAYLKLGQHYLSCSEPAKGRTLLEAGLAFSSSAKALEQLGSSYLDEGRYSIAHGYYSLAQGLPDATWWVYLNLARCLVGLQRHGEAMSAIARGIAAHPSARKLHEELDHIAEKAWLNILPQLLVLVDADDRQQLIARADRFATTMYRAYLLVFGGSAPGEAHEPSDGQNDETGLPDLPALGDINTNKILIVGDCNLPQCERYRINQKLEQLEAVGKEATVISWEELEEHTDELAFHDIVIFYRVPAMPKVIKAIAQVNATGKLSLYEIDDLIMEPEYPPGIESYGGYVSLDIHRGLTRGMSLFHAAARLCRQGIASTEPLRERLKPLVQEQHCLLHRNGLDHLNQFRCQDKSQKRTLDIFYGSGTQAHNNDFTELALPAIERVLKEIPEARLVLVGYLKLPKSFRECFADRYTQIPAIKSVQAYWGLLEQADINLAVLHDDAVNDCKSELKWFEAACFGIPSVVSDTANYRDVIKDGDDAFLAQTSEQWYEALKRLAASPQLRQQVGQAAMQRARDDYNVEVLGNQLVKQFEEAVDVSERPRPKLAMVNVFFPPQSIGGATRVLADNFSTLRERYSQELDLCVFTGDAESPSSYRMAVYGYEGVRVYRASTPMQEHMEWIPRDREMYRLFTEFLELEKPDIIHFHCVQRLTASVVEAARDAGIPYCVTAHDAWWISDFQFLADQNGKVYPEGHPDPYQVTDLPAGITTAASIERRRYLKELLRGATRVLTVSKTFADIYRKNGIREITVIPNGVSGNVSWKPKDTSYTEKVVCGHIGGMSSHKGYYVLKEAVLEIQPGNLEFLIVDHSQEEEYQQQAYWGVVPVTFIGRVSQNNIVGLYRRIDVLFAPSTWPESFGLVTREAAACRCWVVTSNLGGIGEDVIEGKTGYVIEPTREALASQIAGINNKTKRYKKAAPKNKVAVSEEQAHKLFRLYTERSDD